MVAYNEVAPSPDALADGAQRVDLGRGIGPGRGHPRGDRRRHLYSLCVAEVISGVRVVAMVVAPRRSRASSVSPRSPRIGCMAVSKVASIF